MKDKVLCTYSIDEGSLCGNRASVRVTYVTPKYKEYGTIDYCTPHFTSVQTPPPWNPDMPNPITGQLVVSLSDEEGAESE